MSNVLNIKSLTGRRGKLVALALVMALLGAACGGGGFETAGDAASDAMAGFGEEVSVEPSSADDTMVESGPSAFPEQSAAKPDVGAGDRLNLTGTIGNDATTAQLPDLGRDIIFTATLELAATDVSAATRQAIRSIEGRGGFLFSQETRGGSSTLTFKVLPEQFQAALDDLGSVGTVRSQSISADDVSAIVVDLESRINTAEASVTRLRKLLDEASELATIATLEHQLLQRETTLEQLRGQLRTVRNQVDLATITVFVTELLNRPGLAIQTMAYFGHDAGFGCFDADSIGSADAGDPITLCYRLTNTGDTRLVDVALNDPALDATIDSVVVIDGRASEIEPGETLLLAHEFELTEPVRVRTSATATGIDADGNRIDREVKATAATMRFEVLNLDSGLPSFGDVLSNSWSALVTTAAVIALVAVAVAPFLAVALVIGWPIVMIRRRKRVNTVASPPPPTAEPNESPDPNPVEKATTTA